MTASPDRAPTSSSDARFHEIDVLKCVGILAVVLIHSLHDPWNPGISGVERWLGFVTRFAVPGFFAASGYLYATTAPVAWATTRRRLVRVLIPYLIASVAAQLYWFSQGPELRGVWGDGVSIGAIASAFGQWISRPDSAQSGAFWMDFAFGASFGAFYYVYVIVLYALSAHLLWRLGSRWLNLVLVALMINQLLTEAGVVPKPDLVWASLDELGLVSNYKIIFWYLRSPLTWGGYFVLGWWARLHRDRLVVQAQQARAPLVTLSVIGVLSFSTVTATSLPSSVVSGFVYLLILSTIVLCFFVAAGIRRVPPGVQRLSEATYTIYLFHLFFVYGAMKVAPFTPLDPAVGPVFEPMKIGLYWVSGILGTLVLLWLARLAIGSRSRTLLGA